MSEGNASTGAAMAADALDQRMRQHLAGPPAFERGTITSDGRLAPDSWGREPFWPKGLAPEGTIGYERPWHMAAAQAGEPALVGVHDTGTASAGTLLEHVHPTRALQPGDRVLLVWARGVPVVLEVLAP